MSGIANLIMHFAHFLAHSVLSIDKPECTQPFVVKQLIITQQKKKKKHPITVVIYPNEHFFIHR